MVRKVVLFAVMVLAVGWTTRAAAYEVWGVRYDHYCITYDEGLGDAVRQWTAVSALEDCGTSATPDIALRIVDPWPHDRVVGRAFRYRDDYHITGCLIEMPVAHQYHLDVLIHEVGHCLGLQHSDVYASTMNPICCQPMSADDVAGIQSIYGTDVQRDALRGTFRLFVPVVAR